MITRFYMPTDVSIGVGCVDRLASCRSLGKRPLVLCGSRSARASGALDAVLRQLPDAVVLEGFPENPETAVCEAYAAQARSAGVDWVVAVGGGSVIDGAKAIALLVPNGGLCDDYFDAPTLAHAPLPLVVLPTTAGTGSETTPYAVLVDSTLRKKKTLKHPGLFPRMALLEPGFTVALPPDVTVATGLDALSQAMEGMVSLKSMPTGDVIALEICRLIHRHLPRVWDAPDDLEAREGMLQAAMLSGIVIAQSGTTLVHGMGYYYTLEYGIAHGAANALLLPPVFHENARYVPEKVAALAGALGHVGAPEPAAAAASIVNALYELYAKVDFSPAAADHGVPGHTAARMARDIIQEPYRFKNQVGDWDETAVEALYSASNRGRIAP